MDAPERTIAFARQLRRRMTPPELRLWTALRRGSAAGLKFRRQHPIGPYVLDFFCVAAGLAVEVDGEGHWRGDQPEQDARRDAWLMRQGVETLRIEAPAVRDDLEGVVARIVEAAAGRIAQGRNAD